MAKVFLSCLLCCFLTMGCSLSGIPTNVEARREAIPPLKATLDEIVLPGDIILCHTDTTILGGAISISKLIAEMTDSKVTHAAIITQRHSCDDFVIVEVSRLGIQEWFFPDWYMSGSHNIIVMRLKPEYQHLVSSVLEKVNELVERDVLYAPSFETDDSHMYCTSMVDSVFRELGYPLAPKVAIRDMPGYNFWYWAGCLIGGINPNTEIIAAGNEEIGLLSSPMLYPVFTLEGQQSKKRVGFRLSNRRIYEGRPAGR